MILMFCSRQAQIDTGALCPPERVSTETALYSDSDATQYLHVMSWSAKERVKALSIAHAAVLSRCQPDSFVGIPWLLTRGPVPGGRKDISSGRVVPADSGRRRWASRRTGGPSTQRNLHRHQRRFRSPRYASHMPPCVLAMIFTSERAMQRAWMPLSQIPRIGIHERRRSRHVAVVMTAKKAMRIYVYLQNSRWVAGTRRKMERQTETLTRKVPIVWRTSRTVVMRSTVLICSGRKYSTCLPNPLFTWNIARMLWAMAKPYRTPLAGDCVDGTLL